VEVGFVAVEAQPVGLAAQRLGERLREVKLLGNRRCTCTDRTRHRRRRPGHGEVAGQEGVGARHEECPLKHGLGGHGAVLLAAVAGCHGARSESELK
jgi:hypothetical protein